MVILLAAMVAATTVSAAAPARDASDLFLRAYLQIQEGDAAFDRSDYNAAQSRYQDALTTLKDVENVQPDWNPHIISFRQRYCEQRINESKVKLSGGGTPSVKPPVTAPPTTTTAPAITAPAVPSRERDLSSEVDRLRAQVQRMQTERPALTPAPAPTTTKPAATESERVHQLESELADMRRQVQQVLGDKSAMPPPAPLPSGNAQKVLELTDQMGTLRSQLQQMLAERTQWEQSRQDLGRLQAERASLLRQLQEKDQRLAAGPAVMESQQLKTTQEQLAQSARTIEAMRSESKQLSLKLAVAEHDTRAQTAKVAELTPLTGQLSGAKADAEKLRKQIAEKDQQIADKSKALESKALDLARAQDQLKDLVGYQKSNAELKTDLGKAKDQLKDLASLQKTSADLQKSSADLKTQLSKTQALASLTDGRDQQFTAQVERLQKELQELKPKLADAKRKNTKLQELMNVGGDREQLAQLASLRRQLDEIRPKLADAEKKNADLQKQAAVSAGDREQLAQLDGIKRQLEEAERRVSDKTKERTVLEKENALLRSSLDQKIAEVKTAGSTGADRKMMTDLEKELRDLKGQLAVLELGTRKLSPVEEAFLKKTEVVVRPSDEKGISGEISANIRAKERAMAQFAALDEARGIKHQPVVTLAQAGPPPGNVATDAGGAPGPKTTSPPLQPDQGSSAKLPPELKALVDEARELYNQKKFDEASAKYREVLKRDSDNLFGLSNLAVIRFQQDRLEEAEHLLNRALQIAPDDGYSHSIIGIIYFKQDRLDDAIGELTRAIKLNPNNGEAHNFLGIACWRKGWRSAAEQELRRAIELRPDYADAHYNLAVIYATQKPPYIGLAKFHYRKTLDLGRPRDPSLERALAGESSAGEKPGEKKTGNGKK